MNTSKIANTATARIQEYLSMGMHFATKDAAAEIQNIIEMAIREELFRNPVLDPDRHIPEQLTPEKCTAFSKKYVYGYSTDDNKSASSLFSGINKINENPCYLTEVHEMSEQMEQKSEARNYKTIAD